MLPSVISKLRSLYQSVQQEFRNTPIQFSGAAVAIVVLLLPLVSSLLPKDWSSNRIIATMLILQTMNLPLIILSLLLLGWSLFALHKKSNNEKSAFEFIDYAGVSWKILNPNSPELEVEFPSYCRIHKVQHFWNGTYMCPACADKHVPDNWNIDKTSIAQKAVDSLARAKRDNHAQLKSDRK